MDNNNGIPHSYGSYFQFCPTDSPLQRSPYLISLDRERYELAQLMAERQKLEPFMQILPYCTSLLNQEILRLSRIMFSNQIQMEHESTVKEHNNNINNNSLKLSYIGQTNNWPSAVQPETLQENELMDNYHQVVSNMGWHGLDSNTTIVKRVIRLDIPVDKFPNYNFVGRILGPRGNSLKRVEAATGCRVYIRGQGSVKDSIKEDRLKGKAGFEHLEEPLHLVVEAELPEEMIESRLEQAIVILESLLKPVEDESMDYLKREQLRELAMLNGTFTFRRELASSSPFNNNHNNIGMKRPNTGR
ncbi:KH domain-containing protein At3g08620-like [Impatiens glandulifera]|uniref:KH domain-containing protein At3g08620-like n=1 Tax=Impatiens glandulifera TaxID=253017 RepID=UPI001FB09373|nr:KH domain-containing protein At3g08620-like [Impatiens glandulifera]